MKKTKIPFKIRLQWIKTSKSNLLTKLSVLFGAYTPTLINYYNYKIYVEPAMKELVKELNK